LSTNNQKTTNIPSKYLQQQLLNEAILHSAIKNIETIVTIEKKNHRSHGLYDFTGRSGEW
jgi:hypothetical protein